MTPEQLKDFRYKNKLSINQISDILCVSSRTIRRWEAGTIPIPKAVEYAALWLDDKIEVDDEYI